MTTGVNTITAAAYTSMATDDQPQNLLTEKQAPTVAPPDTPQDTFISEAVVPPAIDNQELPPGGKPFSLINIEVLKVNHLVTKSHLLLLMFVLQSCLYRSRTFPVSL